MKMRDREQSRREAVRGPSGSDPHNTATARTASPQCDAVGEGRGGEGLSRRVLGAAAAVAAGRRGWVRRVLWLLGAGAECCGGCGCWTPGLAGRSGAAGGLDRVWAPPPAGAAAVR